MAKRVTNSVNLGQDPAVAGELPALEQFNQDARKPVVFRNDHLQAFPAMPADQASMVPVGPVGGGYLDPTGAALGADPDSEKMAVHSVLDINAQAEPLAGLQEPAGQEVGLDVDLIEPGAFAA